MSADASRDDNATCRVSLDHLSASSLGSEQDTIDINVEELEYRGEQVSIQFF